MRCGLLDCLSGLHLLLGVVGCGCSVLVLIVLVRVILYLWLVLICFDVGYGLLMVILCLMYCF